MFYASDYSPECPLRIVRCQIWERLYGFSPVTRPPAGAPWPSVLGRSALKKLRAQRRSAVSSVINAIIRLCIRERIESAHDRATAALESQTAGTNNFTGELDYESRKRRLALGTRWPQRFYRQTARDAQHELDLSQASTVTMHKSHPMRRSTRLERQIPVLVTSLDPSRSVCEECETVAINAHGCGVIAPVRIPPGCRVMLDLLTDERRTSGVVVDAVALDNSGDNWLIGIQLDNFGNFWGVLDAPSDWRTQEAKISARPYPQNNPDSALAPSRVSDCPVCLTDLSPSACYLETPNPFPVGSALEVEFLAGESQLRSFAVVRLVHPQTGMGLEFTPSGSDEEQALLLLMDLLTASGKATCVKALVRHPRQIPERVRRSQRAHNLAVGDSLLALILSPGSLNKEQFLEELRRQRVQSPDEI